MRIIITIIKIMMTIKIIIIMMMMMRMIIIMIITMMKMIIIIILIIIIIKRRTMLKELFLDESDKSSCHDLNIYRFYQNEWSFQGLYTIVQLFSFTFNNKEFEKAKTY